MLTQTNVTNQDISYSGCEWVCELFYLSWKLRAVGVHEYETEYSIKHKSTKWTCDKKSATRHLLEILMAGKRHFISVSTFRPCKPRKFYSLKGTTHTAAWKSASNEQDEQYIHEHTVTRTHRQTSIHAHVNTRARPRTHTTHTYTYTHEHSRGKYANRKHWRKHGCASEYLGNQLGVIVGRWARQGGDSKHRRKTEVFMCKSASR